MAISLIVVILFVVIAILIVAGIKVETRRGGEEVINNVYVYLVLFATLMMTIGGSVGIFMAMADIIAPAPYYQTFEDYQRWAGEKPSPDREVIKEVELSEKELRESYESMVAAEKERQSERAKNSLIKSFGWIIIPFPVFLYFQRRVARNET